MDEIRYLYDRQLRKALQTGRDIKHHVAVWLSHCNRTYSRVAVFTDLYLIGCAEKCIEVQEIAVRMGAVDFQTRIPMHSRFCLQIKGY